MSNQYRSVLASGGAGTGGDAVAANVLAGKTFTNDNGFDTGTMVNNGAVSQTLNAGQSYTIPEGYHNGSGVVNASAGWINSLTEVSLSTNTFTGVKDKYYVICGSGNNNDGLTSVTNCELLETNYKVNTGGGAGCAIVKCTTSGTCTVSHTFSHIRLFELS